MLCDNFSFVLIVDAIVDVDVEHADVVAVVNVNCVLLLLTLAQL